MKNIILLIVILIRFNAYGQNTQVDELSKLYMSGDLDLTIQKANEHLLSDKNNIDYKLILGRALTDKGKYLEAIPNLEFAINNDKSNSWRKAWGLAYLGTCYYSQQKYNESKKSLDECIDLNATKNVTNYAKKKSVLYGFDDFYSGWKIVESDNFRFHFQKMNDSDIKNFISTREGAFTIINDFFKSKVPKKIDFFVWESKEDARNLLRTELGFSEPALSIVHAHFQQTKGHEMTHVISNFSTSIIKKTGLINEGTAVYFDQSNKDKEQLVKDWIKANDKKISITAIWYNWKELPEELTYPLSGLFVKELIDNFGRDKFLDFYGNQTYENASKIFRNNVDSMITKFENKFNN